MMHLQHHFQQQSTHTKLLPSAHLTSPPRLSPRREGSRVRPEVAAGGDGHGSESEAEGSSHVAGDEDGEDSMPTPWELGINKTVYCEALVLPAIIMQNWTDVAEGTAREVFPSPRWMIIVSFFLLAVNAAMQAGVVWKLSGTIATTRDDTVRQIFGGAGNVGGGMCYERLGSNVHWGMADPNSSDERLLVCFPDLLLVAMSFDRLDLDRDGVWTRQEAESLEEQQLRSTGYEVCVFRYFRRTLAYLTHRPGTFQTEGFPAVGAAQARTLTQDGAVVPRSLYIEEMYNVTKVCTAIDPAMCSNLHYRASLASVMSRIHTDDMTEVCESMISRLCPFLFDELYKLHQVRFREVCGNTRTTYDVERRLRTVDFNTDNAYNASNDAITKPVWQIFLCIIMLIWYMIMVKEVRDIMQFVIVLLFMPSAQKLTRKGVRCVDYDDAVVIRALPSSLWCATILLNVLPRFCIIVAVTYQGTMFLLSADKWEVLIIDSVALAFLIEIDELLYEALVGDCRKEQMAACKSIRADTPFPRRVTKKLSATIIYISAMIVCIAAFVLYDFCKKYGKYAYAEAVRCLCEISGEECLSARILGGFDTVRAARAAWTALSAGGGPLAGLAGGGRGGTPIRR